MGTFIALILGIIIFVVIIGVVFVYDALAWGLVLYKFWGWFVLPVFTTLPELDFVHALGLMFVINLFKNTYAGDTNIKDEYKKNKNSSTWTLLLTPWVALFFGWLAYVIWLV
jgi:hypothetical protein